MSEREWSIIRDDIPVLLASLKKLQQHEFAER
jgi:hypothetical protein